jgi:hypothetical protein
VWVAPPGAWPDSTGAVILKANEGPVVDGARWRACRGELRDARPGAVLGRDAGFWLRGTGISSLEGSLRQ